MTSVILLRPSVHKNKQFSGHKIDPMWQFPLFQAQDNANKNFTLMSHQKLLLPLFAISKREKKLVLDGLLTVSVAPLKVSSLLHAAEKRKRKFRDL
jgi:hypothetical protein